MLQLTLYLRAKAGMAWATDVVVANKARTAIQRGTPVMELLPKWLKTTIICCAARLCQQVAITL
jgi:hypothetical protein